MGIRIASGRESGHLLITLMIAITVMSILLGAAFRIDFDLYLQSAEVLDFIKTTDAVMAITKG